MTRRKAACALGLPLIACLAAVGFASTGGSATPSAAAARPCEGAAAIDFGCHARRYAALVSTRGPRPALADLVAQRDRSGFVRAACHQLMHVVGRTAGRRHGIRALELGDPNCSSGYYHGVVEAVTGRIGAHDVQRAGAAVCEVYRVRRPRTLAHYNCAHGMGHGFMGVYGSDVFRSLDGCATLPSRWEREHCEGGVFMENLSALDNKDRPSRHVRPEAPLYPCTAVARRHKRSCYIKQTAYPLLLTNGDFRAVFRLCATVPDVAFRPACYHGLGGDAAVRANKLVDGREDAHATIRALCRLAPHRAAQRQCVIGAVTVVVKDGAAQRTGLGALCRSFDAVTMRTVCLRAARKQLKRFPTGQAPATAVADRRGPQALCHLLLSGRRRPEAGGTWPSTPALPGGDEERS